MNPMQKMDCKTSFHPCLWHNYITWWAGGTNCTDIAVVVVDQIKD